MVRIVGMRLVLTAVLSVLLPATSFASSVTSVFLSSSSGTSTIGLSDSIQFEVSITTEIGKAYNSISWSLTGDIDSAIAEEVSIDNMVVDWAWHYTPPGTPRVQLGTDLNVVVGLPPIGIPDRVTGPYGYFGVVGIGTGVSSLVGTVTIHADAVGNFSAGGFMSPGVDGFLGTSGADTVLVSGASFTVVPEPSTIVLLAAGVAALARKSRRRF
jgi:hypothetical protein